MANVKRFEADVVIAGGGPGGCALANDLSKKGKKVILLEKGRDDKFLYGTPFATLLNCELAPRFPMPVRGTMQGENVMVGNGLGGGTLFYAGSAFLPDLDYWKKVGVDIEQDIIDETVKETWATMPPEDFIGPATRRISDAANELGYPFEKCMRHVDFEKCEKGCVDCVLGCKLDAKWSGKVLAHEAQKYGAQVMVNTKVDHIIIEDGVAVGVAARCRGEEIEVRAPLTVCASGGVGTVGILKNSGIHKAGSWFSGDPTTFTFGFLPAGQEGNAREHSMTYGWYDKPNHVIFCGMASPPIAWELMFIQDEWLKALPHIAKGRRVLSIFAKCSDDGVGRIFMNGDISNTFTENDYARQEYGRAVCKEILVKAGCDPYEIHTTGITLGHPSGTVRVGELLGSDFQMKDVKNLYCCDTSATPGAPGLPPALTITAIGKQMARNLVKEGKV